jgi:hypothetical protein
MMIKKNFLYHRIMSQQDTLYNHSQLQNMTFKNLAIFPSYFSTSASTDTIIYWANVNFQEFGVANKRIWQFNASGIANQNFTKITFIIATRYNISLEGPLSGWLTSSSNVINAYDVMKISSISDPDKTIINVYISQAEPLQVFSFSIFQKDDGNCGQSGVPC